ncbi:MAG: hypothetical protein JWQ00_1241 [Noviherbaspirillum sp.]|jgi:outer membrane lipoprotein-sorting protein|nr:hypothetical protein [Noviherbaspirillum sp.]
MKFASRRLFVGLLSLALLSPAASFAAEWNVDQLMQALAKAKPGRAAFVEKKFISLLDRPVESSGQLLYIAPNRLEKRTIKPKPENMVVDGNTLTIERGSQKHTLQLQEYPDLAGFIDGIRGTLAGDRKALERSFRLRLEGAPERWTLMLNPTDAAMARSVHLIRITGVQDDVRGIDVIQTDGDRSEMKIERGAVR